MANPFNWSRIIAILSVPALMLAVACGSAEPPPDTTVEELTKLQAAGVEGVDEELERMQAQGVAVAGDADQDSAAPSASTVREVALLKTAGSEDAREQLAAWESEAADPGLAVESALVLARFSTPDDREGQRRANAAGEIVERLEQGRLSDGEAISLMQVAAPELSISERKKAVDRLKSIAGDGELGSKEWLQVANELTRLVSGHGIDADRRASAARRMIELSKTGDLNADNGSELMDAVAPEFSVSERREALGFLVRQFQDGGWGAEGTKRTAEKGYTVITGTEMDVEERVGAGVGLTGEALKRYGGDSYDDESIDTATELIQEALSGDLDTDTTSEILGWDD